MFKYGFSDRFRVLAASGGVTQGLALPNDQLGELFLAKDQFTVMFNKTLGGKPF
jgi:hypothetical protein